MYTYDQVNPHLICSSYIKKMFDYDLTFVFASLSKWKNREKVDMIQENINNFLKEKIKLHQQSSISFYDHFFYFFCISIILSGYSVEHVSKIYQNLNDPIIFEKEISEQKHFKYIYHIDNIKSGSFKTVIEIPSIDKNQKNFLLVPFLCNLNEFVALKKENNCFIEANNIKIIYATYNNIFKFIKEKISQNNITKEKKDSDKDENVLKKLKQ
jgi:hypothetical protein